MNMKRVMNQTERLVYNSYHLPGCSNLHKRKVNAIFISPANSIEHELAKTRICYLLLKNKQKFITEAVENKTNLRRDVVSLSGEIYEIEKYGNGKGRGHRHPDNVNVFFYDTQGWRKGSPL
jgi:hypothetical protein